MDLGSAEDVTTGERPRPAFQSGDGPRNGSGDFRGARLVVLSVHAANTVDAPQAPLCRTFGKPGLAARLDGDQDLRNTRLKDHP